MRQIIEDLFFVGSALMFTALGFWTMWYTQSERQSLRFENQELRRYTSQLCQYINSLPVEYRVTFEVCLQTIRR